MKQLGLYEQLLNKLFTSKLQELDRDKFYIKETALSKNEAARVLSTYLGTVIKTALNFLSGENKIEKQIELSNKIILLLRDELKQEDFEDDLISTEAKILSAIFSKLDAPFNDLDQYLQTITPYTRLSHSELFTGSNAGVSMESEIKKEILSSNEIHFLVSFIKWTGIRIFKRELETFTERGGQLKIITTSYMGATDVKAVEYLSSLKNASIKVSYNTDNERLHAKAYLFLRDTGFHTGYIGSSNLSRSALTNGLEWNLKVTTKEVSHIIQKFQKTFDTYWQDKEFEFFDIEKEKVDKKLRKALKRETRQDFGSNITFFDIRPYSYQKEILEQLATERVVHKRYKNLVVAATGTGKTIISAFDYQRFKQNNKRARLLFLAHRKEIIEQARNTFRAILKDNNFGELWVDGLEPESFEYTFASVQTLNNRIQGSQLTENYYDYIIIDEVHHIAASSYRAILKHFSPSILLGLTATPERMDNANILEDFCHTIAAEIRLPEALNRKLLCPFQYFGISDSVDLSNVQWRGGKYVPSELTRIYTQNDNRVREIIQNLESYLTDIQNVRALCFCVSQEHAQYMAEKFSLAHLKADYLVSSNSQRRSELRQKLLNKDINYLFVVDIFNEGVDIPDIDTVLFLRPTESLTVFLQQLGRGLRLADGKECLTVLDFVGNARPEYDYERKFRALIGKTAVSTQKEIEDNFPHLPLGCTIILEKQARENILQNIKAATKFSRNNLIHKISNFKHQTSLALTLKNFISFHQIPLQVIYKKGSWKRLCVEANQMKDFSNKNEREISKAISSKFLACSSISYFQFILKLAQQNFKINLEQASEEEKAMALMLHYDIWQAAKGFASLEISIQTINQNPILVEELTEVIEILMDKIDYLEKPIQLPFQQPLRVHSRYTRDQILTAFQFSTFQKKSSSREGVAENKNLNTELLFIDLIKSENDFSPTTLYDDYAVSEDLFHWQSQNATRPDKGKGLSYINHKKDQKTILLFVREQKKDSFGNTMAYVFVGAGNFVEYSGSKPMNILWQLKIPLPIYLWKVSAKMAVG